MTPGSSSASRARAWGSWEVTLAASSCLSRPVAMLREPMSPARGSTTFARWSAGSRMLQAIPGTSSVHRTRTISRTLPSPTPSQAAPRRSRSGESGPEYARNRRTTGSGLQAPEQRLCHWPMSRARGCVCARPSDELNGAA